MLRQSIAEIGGYFEELCQTAVLGRWTRSELHAGAEVVLSFFAASAGSAGEAGFDGDVVVGLEMGYSGADGVDRARRFVAEDQGLGRGDIVAVDAAVVPEVDVAAADANVLDADYGVVGGCDLGDWRVLHLCVAGAVEED